MKKLILLFFLSPFILISYAQNNPNMEGTYIGKFSQGGFEDTLIFTSDSLIINQDLGWYYGIQHTYIYSIKNIENDSVHLQEIAHLVESKLDTNSYSKSGLNNLNIRILKLKSGNLIFFYPNSKLEDSSEFELISIKKD